MHYLCFSLLFCRRPCFQAENPLDLFSRKGKIELSSQIGRPACAGPETEETEMEHFFTHGHRTLFRRAAICTLVLGMISFMRDVYVITSNRESGYGRFDIMLKPRAEHRDFPAVVIEVKAAKTEADDLDALAAEARHQIDEKNYAALLVAEGITDIMKFGIAFFAKRAAIAK